MIPTKKYMILSILLGSIYTGCYAQQDSEYTQYMYNTVAINPAYAGSRGHLSANLLYRSQWVGLDGAPEVLNFSLNTPIGLRGAGLGLSFFNDRIGPSDESNVAADFSYTIKLGWETHLSFGLKVGVNLLNVDYSKLNIFDPTDPNFQNNIDNRLSPSVGPGIYLRHHEKWYLGLSSPNVLSTDHFDDVAISNATERANIYLIGGYVFDFNRNLKFKPAFLVKAVSGAPLDIDLSANFLFSEAFSLGASYRWDAGASALIGFQISPSLMFGYAYDYDASELGNYNSGSHELFLRFELGTRVRRSVSARFF
ncbi:MAG: type IX secretion system membrane protein PorP/SprF [Bacteroidota bacterium]